MASPNAFGLQHSRDLYNKLVWEIEQLRNCPPGPGSPVAYYAFNCAVTAWHITDWVWHSLTGQQKTDVNKEFADLNLADQGHFERYIRRRSEDLRICYVIAQRVKHHTLRPKVEDPTIYVAVSVGPVAPLKIRIRDHDAIDEGVIERAKVVIGGESRPALYVFEAAAVFWDDFIKIHKVDPN